MYIMELPPEVPLQGAFDDISWLFLFFISDFFFDWPSARGLIPLLSSLSDPSLGSSL